MAKFHIKDTFEIEGRDIFVMAGSILEGTIRKGMFVHVQLNSAVSICEPIHAIEMVLRTGGSEDVGLCFKLDQETREFARAVNIADEVIEVTSDGSGS
jgi:hypothetical protein